ncbi:deoxyribodipyrimidine photo-lyase [Halobacteriales archaeon QS_8_69_26]|nr:MAG: deoxyribodipyrimidine photo-lyase [Halobacteriales archaeon QS_8_69_26]
MRIHWHRRDLRVADNVALAEAARTEGEGETEDGGVVPVFVFDPAVLDHGSPPRVRFMLDALGSLRADYRERGGDLLLERGDPREVLPLVADEWDAEAVHWNRDYSGLARRRDAAVRRALDDAGVRREASHGELLHEPGSITTNQGEHYSVYTYFWKKWRDRPKDDPRNPPAADALATEAGESDPLPTLSELGFEEPEADVEPAGTDRARERLVEFCGTDPDLGASTGEAGVPSSESGAGEPTTDDERPPVYRYADRRDYPADRCTSRLSAHLTWGTVGVREAYAHAAAATAAARDEDERESAEEFESQLAWREFYYHVLAANPEVVTENFRSYENPIEWRDDPEALQAWKDGETGYPIVDAGMRQLRREAFVHNRVRMIVASFLTKDLLIDWREGYDWFRRKLVDHDTANDNGGWQWAASTGTDAQPYFRIFNPMTQGEQYDPDAEYVREYVPELRDATPDQIHGWHELPPEARRNVAPDYPAPIVDHSERREAALAMFEAARGEDD